MSNLYQDAILDAKALRASAIANAKAALEEAFEPKIQEMLRAKLSEEEVTEIAEAEEIEEVKHGEEDIKEEVAVEESTEINEQELDEILAQLEELEQVDEAKHSDKKDAEHDKLDEAKEEEEGEEEEAEEGEEEAGEEGEGAEAEEVVDDETKVIDITLGDLKQVLQSVMGAQADLGMPAEEPTADSEAEAEISLDEILDELEAEGAEDIGHYDAADVQAADLQHAEDFGMQEKKHGKQVNEVIGGEIDPAILAAVVASATAAGAIPTAMLNWLKKNKPEAYSKVQQFIKGASGGIKGGTTSMKEEKQENNEQIEEVIGGEIDPAILAAVVASATAAGAIPSAMLSWLKKNKPELADKIQQFIKGASSGIKGGTTSMEEKKDHQQELEEAKATIEAMRKDLQEVNLLNAKYLYMNKLFKSKSLTESQKMKVINALDRAASVAEVKNTYDTLKESLETKKQTIKESIGFASKPAGMAPKANIVEADGFISRWQKLAGIK